MSDRRENGSKQSRGFAGKPERREKKDNKDRNDRSKDYERGDKSINKKFTSKPERRDRTEKDNRPERKDRDSSNDKPFKKKFTDKPSYRDKKDGSDRPSYRDKKEGSERSKRGIHEDRPEKKKRFDNSDSRNSDKKYGRRYDDSDRPKKRYDKESKEDNHIEEVKGMRLNRYIANSGVCSRREADELIASGAVTVNGKVVSEMGYRIKEGDKIVYGGELLKSEKKVYILMNKPKDYITILDDNKGKKTVLDLLGGNVPQRVSPVGKLDRNSTGVLLLTNDNELAKKLLNPKFSVKRIYHVTLDKKITYQDLNKIAAGIELEDGFVKPEAISFTAENVDKKNIGIEINSGKVQVIRRIFEKFGCKVVKLDRVSFGGLTKKNLSRGDWRHLSEQEVNFLKMASVK